MMIYDIRARKGFDKFLELIKEQDKRTILDIGCGKDQPHSRLFKKYKQFSVSTCDFFSDNEYNGKLIDIDFEGKQFDAIWCSHCLEHQEDVGSFLKATQKILKEDGLLCITVPPMKHDIVGGHLTLWNTGLLYYNLILAGFDCSDAVHKNYGYNISIILNKKTIEDMSTLFYDSGDIELLSKYFPFEAVQGFNGNELKDTF